MASGVSGISEATCTAASFDRSFTDFALKHIPLLDEKVKQARDATLETIATLARKWVNELGEKQNKKLHSHCFGCQILPFGSYTFGLSTNDSDLDVVIVVPEFVNRESFFDSFLEILRGEEGLEEIRTVEGARVPLIQLQHQGTEVDLLFCQVYFPEVPCLDDLIGIDILRCMDTTSLRSLNGLRETKLLIELVPDMKPFTEATRFVKHWAKCHGLHQGSFGFLGGFCWCIMMAHICQLYPELPGAELISIFFRVYSQWDWSKPVLLKPLCKDKFNLNPWNPKSVHSDGLQKMCLIAPAYPEHNVAFTVTLSTRALLKDHFRKAHEVIEKIAASEAQWEELLQSDDFTTKYRHYLVVSASSFQMRHRDWAGLVASTIRSLVISLERQPAVDLVHPCSKSFSAKEGERCLTRWLLGIQFVKTKGLRVDLESDIKKFDRSAHEKASERSIFMEGMTTTVAHVKRNQLQEWIPKD